MVNKKKLRKYLDKQFHGLQHNLDEITIEMDKNKLHELRLHAKKIKALSGFLKETLHRKNKYSIKELKELFHTAGDIRIAQLNLETVKETKIKNESFEKKQNDIIEKESEAIIMNNKKFNKNISSLRKKIRKNLTAIKNNRVVSFYYDNIKILSNYFKVIDERNLHDSRKMIKKLLYNLKILPYSIAEKININKDYLDHLQDLIGKWHDTGITLNSLTKSQISDKESLDSLTKQKEDQLKKIVYETAEFDTNVMFAKPASTDDMTRN